MQRVFQATPYQPGTLGSTGNAAYMLLRQYQFPDEYDERLDTHLQVDHDRLFQQDHEHASRCFKTYIETGDMNFPSWLWNAKDSAIILFLKDLMKADARVNWTGYRVMGSVHRGNGFPVFTLELFAKHQKSKTKVYSGDDAPNVLLPAQRRMPPGIFRTART